MAAPRLMKTGRVPVAAVEAGARLRPVSEAGVEALLASIREVGVMKDAIHVRQKKGGALALIAGAHRLEAARRLGWDEIEAKVWADVTDDWARLMEIDDNIAGAELTALDTALFLAARKRVYERLHPETVRGVAGALARWDATDTMSVAFARATAEKFGMSDRHVRRLIAAGLALDEGLAAQLRAAPRAVTLKDLAVLAKIHDPGERAEVVSRLAGGKAPSAVAARRALLAEQGLARAPLDPVEAQMLALKTAWGRAGKEARRRFLRDHRDEVSALLFGGGLGA